MRDKSLAKKLEKNIPYLEEKAKLSGFRMGQEKCLKRLGINAEQEKALIEGKAVIVPKNCLERALNRLEEVYREKPRDYDAYQSAFDGKADKYNGPSLVNMNLINRSINALKRYIK